MISKIPFFFRFPKPGEVVVLQHPQYGTLIKRVERVSRDRDEIYVIGNHPFSVDSRQFGPVKRERLKGKVICHISRPGSS